MGGRMYRAKEFAELAGVTVRALHHYDRLGLLEPERTRGGYRLYRQADLERLEHIVALKFIGVPLKEIKNLLGRSELQLGSALSLQRRVLLEKRRFLDAAIGAIEEAGAALTDGRHHDFSVLQKIIEVIEMQDNPDWMMKYFKEDVQSKVQARKAAWTPELQARAEQDWLELFRDVRDALNEDPGSAKAQALVDRWNNLIAAFTGDDQSLVHGVKALYADRQNWPAAFHEKVSPFTDERVWDFYRKAAAARQRTQSGQ